MTKSEQMMNDWILHRNVLVTLVDTIADNHVHFKPWEGAMVLGELALHTVQWNDYFVSLVKNGKADYPKPIKCETMAEVRHYVRELTDKTIKEYKTITDTELESERVFPSGFLGTGKTFLTMMYDHEIHHKGQLYVYARMVGMKELPFFRDSK